MGIRAAVKELLLDPWSSVSYKSPMKDGLDAANKGYFAPSWLSPKQARRLNAYMVFAAYEANTARAFIEKTVDDDPEENREYGDAALIIDQVLAALLGETQEIVVRGAEDYDPHMVDPADAPPEPEEGQDPGEAQEPDEDAIAAWAANLQAQALAEAQEFLRDWADTVHLGLRMADCERNAVMVGDAVYLLGWDAESQTVKPAVMDPGFYFPVLPDEIDGYSYPDKVHFAWELPGEDFLDGKKRLRRLTYELRDIMWEPVKDSFGNVIDMVAPEGTKVETDQTLSKVYPWSAKPSKKACYLTDATWLIPDVDDAHEVDDLSYAKASFALDEDDEPIRNKDLGIDFVPVIHVPNTPAGGNHFGQSSLSRVLQLMDDLQATDTDAQRASATTGSPIVVIHGVQAPGSDAPRNRRALDAEAPKGAVEDRSYELSPGSALFVGESGGATVVNTAEQLAELRNLVSSLRDRMSVNSRLPSAVLGTMKPSEAPSGYAIQLSFGPLNSMIRQMRLTRSVKYPLFLKMAQRIFQVNDVDGKPGLAEGSSVFAEMRFGSYLPSDMAGTLELVKSAWGATPTPLISLETGIAMLVEVGFPVEDIAEEIERIQSRDYEGANALADVLGDVNVVREYLGLEPLVEEPVAAPDVTLPGSTPPVVS